MKLLQNKVAIVTGASAGIGRATATLFASHGAAVILGARRENALAQMATEITASGGKAAYLAGDVGEEGYNEAVVSLALEHFGGLHVAFNNAGTLGFPGPVTKLSAQNWEATMRTNLTSAFFAAKHQLPALTTTKGSLIFTASFVGNTIGLPEQAAYAASKAGMVGLSKTLAAEYGPAGVRVNALLPGGTNTRMAEEFGEGDEARQFVQSLHALKRTADPEEIANAALYLASDMASFVTGSALLVDGGVSINKT